MGNNAGGCHNREPFASGYWTQSFNPQWVEDRMTTDCQFSRLKTNAGYPTCQTCKHKQDANL